jgi:prephenate dehydratase
MRVPPSSRIAFQGERGAFSEEAAVKLLGEDIQLVPRPTFEALYTSIEDGVADYFIARMIC